MELWKVHIKGIGLNVYDNSSFLNRDRGLVFYYIEATKEQKAPQFLILYKLQGPTSLILCVSWGGGVGAISETCLLMAILWEGEVLAPLVQQKYVSIFVITVLLSISVLKLSGNSRINIRFTQHRISLGNRLKAIKIIIKTLKTCRLCYSPPMQIHFGEEDIRLDVM